MKQRIPKTFQKKLIFFNLVMMICIASAISIYSYSSYTKDLIAREVDSSKNRLHSLTLRLDIACNEMINIVQNCAGRKTLSILSPMRKTDSPSNEALLYSANILKDLCSISGYSQYISKLIIYEKDHLYLQTGATSGNYNDVDSVLQTSWFYSLLSKQIKEYQLTLEENPFQPQNSNEPYIIPLIQPLYHNTKTKPEDAWVLLVMSPDIFSDALQTLPEQHSISIMTADFVPISSIHMQNYSINPILEVLKSNNSLQGNITLNLSGQQSILTWERLPVSGLIFFEVIPIARIPKDVHVIHTTILIVFMSTIVIGLILSLLFSRYLSHPIIQLTKHMQKVACGDFCPDPSIETNDELGIIGHQINEMSTKISDLMEMRIQNEKEKMELEIKILQTQINPHFLYNTLDSIKWIATMQHNSGIVKIVSSLSCLLKNMAKGFNEKVTLTQELEFLNHYITIAKIRYIELFDVNITVDDPALYDAYIIKLTLQPIVENSIFSGIEPNNKPGLIDIHVYSREDTLYISIRDNGVGMSQEKIDRILDGSSPVSKQYMTGIGLPNVDRRIKLVYGEHYGLHIESEVGSYTCITLSMPLEFNANIGKES